MAGGALLIYVGPAIMSISLRQRNASTKPLQARGFDGLGGFDGGLPALWGLTVLGVTLGGLGTLEAVTKTFGAS